MRVHDEKSWKTREASNWIPGNELPLLSTKSKMDEAIRFQVKEDDKIVSFDFSDSLRYNDKY